MKTCTGKNPQLNGLLFKKIVSVICVVTKAVFVFIIKKKY